MSKEEMTDIPAPETEQGDNDGAVVTYDDYRDYAAKNDFMYDYSMEVERGYIGVLGCDCQKCMEKASNHTDNFQMAAFAMYLLGLEKLLEEGFARDGYMFLQAVGMGFEIVNTCLKIQMSDPGYTFSLIVAIILCLQLTRYRDDRIYDEVAARRWPVPCGGKVKNNFIFGHYHMPVGFPYVGWVERTERELDNLIEVRFKPDSTATIRSTIEPIAWFIYLVFVPASPTRH